MKRPSQTVSYAEKAVLDNIRDSIISNSKGKLITEADIKLAEFKGRELKLEFGTGFAIARVFIVGPRVYQIIASMSQEYKTKEPVTALRVLDSFRILSQEEVDKEIQLKVAAATPSPLPQSPVINKTKSDADDDGLKAHVKSVFTQTEDKSGTWSVSGIKPSSMKEYNERGGLVRWQSYDYRGNPFEITVYGYLEGLRVSSVGRIDYEYNPPDIELNDNLNVKVQSPKIAKRYSYRHKHTYDPQGRLKEELTYGNDGHLITRIVYVYSPKQQQELIYDGAGQLTDKSVAVLDSAGNKAEEIYYDVKDGSVKDKYRYEYAFDGQGNWTKQLTLKWEAKDNKSDYLPYSVDYRTITYF